jgi:hypothetical protein
LFILPVPFRIKKMLRAELKETFLRKLTRPERLFFLHQAREAIVQKEYRPGEDISGTPFISPFGNVYAESAPRRATATRDFFLHTQQRKLKIR